MHAPTPSIGLFATSAVASFDDLRAEGLNALDEAERARAGAMRSTSALSQFVSRRSRLRDEMAARTGVRHEEIAYWREPCTGCGEPHGRPRAAGFDGYFSTSSTDHVTAVATHEHPVGIDVEALAPLAVVTDVTPMLHPAERAAIRAALAACADQGRRAFTQIWTRKEALLKATGEGLSAALDRDDVHDPARHPIEGWRIVDITDDLTGHDGPPTYGAWACVDASSRGVRSRDV